MLEILLPVAGSVATKNYPFGEDSRDAGEMTAKSRGTWRIGGAA